MPIAPIAILGVIPEIADVLTLAGLGGGTIGWAFACTFQGTCPQDTLGTKNVPVARVDQRQDVAVAMAGKRQDVGPCNVPMYNFDMCKDQASSVKVMGSAPSPDVAQFDNVPAACMDLVVVLSGSCAGDGNRPVVCGSACVKYTGLSDVQLASIKETLNA